tara:strand:+ start:933 stop:1172 length:240 start_codon:yes stop_codon:yes gene_type:complete
VVLPKDHSEESDVVAHLFLLAVFFVTGEPLKSGAWQANRNPLAVAHRRELGSTIHNLPVEHLQDVEPIAGKILDAPFPS